jgi:hypothetical protein
VSWKGSTTVKRIQAQRRNAALSTGPRTIEGRRRSALNRRGLAMPKLARKIIRRLKAKPEDFLRTWRDVLAIFWFMGPELDPFLDAVAWDWWLKQHRALSGEANELTLRAIDARLEHNLHNLVSAYRMTNRKWRCRLKSELGSAGRAGVWQLRLAVEARLRPYPDLVRDGRLPKESPLELAIDRWSREMWDPDAPLTNLGDDDEDGFDDIDELLEDEDELFEDDEDEFQDENEPIGV